jgi:hypothetical protein
MTKLILSSFTVCLVLSLASAQQVTPAPSPADAKAQQELIRKAEDLLIETTKASRDLKTPENQINVRINMADLLWKDQPVLAQGLYKEALDALAELQKADDTRDVDDEFGRSLSLTQIREAILKSLGQHDPAMARSLLHDTRLPVSSAVEKSDDVLTSQLKSADTRLELSLAAEMVEQNPKEAARIAHDALKDGYSFELMGFLTKLIAKDSEAGREFAGEIANKLRKENLTTNYDAASFVTYFLHEAVSSALPPTEDDQSPKQTPWLDSQTLQELIQMLIDISQTKQKGSHGGSIVRDLSFMIADLEKVAPAQAASLKQKIAEASKTSEQDPPSDRFDRYAKLEGSNDPKEILDAVKTAPPEAREALYAQAATAAFDQGDQAQANEILKSKISDPRARRRLAEEFQQRTIMTYLDDENFVEARKAIAQIRSVDKRRQAFLDLATAVGAKGDKKTTGEILQEALDLTPAKARNENELEAQFRIAAGFAEIDPDRTFTIVGSAIDQINELSAAAATLADFGHYSAGIKDGEFSIDSTARLPFGFTSFSSRDLGTLAQFDFNRTRALLDKLQRPEMRIAGYLMLSRSLLAPEPVLNDCTCKARLKRLKEKAAKKVAP